MPAATAEQLRGQIALAFVHRPMPTEPNCQSAEPTDAHTGLRSRMLAHLDRTAPIARVTDSRVILTTQPTDARDPQILETGAYGRIDLRTASANVLADLVRRGVTQAEGALYKLQVRHEGKHRAEEGQSTLQQTIVFTKQRAEQGARFDAAADHVARLSQQMDRHKMPSDKKNKIWDMLIRTPSLLAGMLRKLEIQRA